MGTRRRISAKTKLDMRFVIGYVKGLGWGTTVVVLFLIFTATRIFFAAWSPPIFPSGTTMSARGSVMSVPVRTGNFVRYRLRVREVFKDGKWEGARGTIAVMARFPSNFSYGDTLSLTCDMETPSGFAAGRLRAQGATALCWPTAGIEKISEQAGNQVIGAIMRLRTRAVDKIGMLYPEPFAGLLAGLVLGERGSLSDTLRAALQRTGTTHMIAISGFNVAMITSALFMFCLFIFGRRFALAITMMLLGIFVALVGAGASVVRAALMGATVLFARHFGRPVYAPHLILLVGAVMVFVNPWLLFYDLGFILSFAATAGLLIFSPAFKKYFERIPAAYGIRATLSDTCAAIVATLPFTLFSFGTVSIIAPLANLLVLFLVPIATWSGFLTLFMSWIPGLGPLIVWFLRMVLTAMVGFIEILSRLPFASFKFPFAQAIAVLVGGAILVWAYRLNKKQLRAS